MLAAALVSCPIGSPSLLRTDVDATTRQAALAYAESALDSAYVWGGNGPVGFDCSGLIVWAYQPASGVASMFNDGASLVADITMQTMFDYNTSALALEEVLPGDVVFITSEPGVISHGGMVSRVDGKTITFINASSYCDKVVLDTWSTDERVRDQWIAGFGRMQFSKIR